MKAVLEFGVRGGAHVDSIVIPTTKLAAVLASSIASVLDIEPEGTRETDFTVSRLRPRVSLTDNNHFVSVTALDRVLRGPASSNLWRKLK